MSELETSNIKLGLSDFLEVTTPKDELWLLVQKLREENEKLRESLQWFINEDETFEGDEPLPEYNGNTWDELNEYWLDGKRKAQALLVMEAYDVWFRARVKCILDNPGNLIPNDEVIRQLREKISGSEEDSK